ncbi:MAG: hypothetical protein CAF41_006150 [Nitrospira sp. CG24A]|nr:MAG: hypothetical protein CAF41_006150 [Nitrospira sp. CG24A]
MTRPGLSRSTALVAGLVALVYVSLAAMAASCALHHADPSSRHAHHDSHEAVPHNALCAWACQSTSDAGLVTEPPTLATSLVVRLAPLPPNQEAPSSFSSLLHSRAPPLVSFVCIG